MNSIENDIHDIQGYRFPFEGEKHLCTVIEVPYRKDTWRNDASPAIDEFLSIVKAISEFEMVVVVIDPKIPYQIVRKFDLPNTHILRLPYNDSWARDNTPVFLRQDSTGSLAAADFSFNAWGGSYNGLYKDYADDDFLGALLARELYIHHYDCSDLILEGGSIHTDGEGTLLVTESCLLSKGRNPSLTKDEIENKLKDHLNIEKVLWLPYGIYEDETDGHIDNIACFSKPGQVLLAWTEDKNDPQYEMSRKDYEYLSSVNDAKGRSLDIVKVMLPEVQKLSLEEASGIVLNDNAIERLAGRRLAASYINFYLGEEFVILPQFGTKEDETALKQFNSIFPERKIVPIYSREILLGGGNIHCITKQVPFSNIYEIEPKEGKNK